jgi:hypothetical protein
MNRTSRDFSARKPFACPSRAGLLATAILGAVSLAQAGTPIVDVETNLGGGNGVYMDLQSATTGFTNQGVKGTWSNWTDSWGFKTAAASTGDGSAAGGPGDTSDAAITVFGRSADDKGQTTTEIRVDYTSLVPNASYFFWIVALQNTQNGTSHDVEWGVEAGNLTKVVGEPGYTDAAWIAGAAFGAGTQLVGVPLGQVSADDSGNLTLYYDQGEDPGNKENVNRTQIDGVLFEQIVDPHCLLPWAPNGTKIESNGSVETLEIAVENLAGSTQDLVVSGAVVEGSEFDLFTVPADQFPMTLAPGATASISVEFDPAAVDFAGSLTGDNALIVTSNHGGIEGSTVRTPISGWVRNPWISTVDAVDLGTIPAAPPTKTFSLEISNVGASVELEVYDIVFSGARPALFTLVTDLTDPLIIGPGGKGTLEFSFDSGGIPDIYSATIELTTNDSMVDPHIVPVTVTVVESLPIQIVVNGYDAGTGMLSVTANNVPADKTFHFEKSADLESFAPLGAAYDFTSGTPWPMSIPVDPAADPKLFLQAFEGATNQ